jgi:hypothetical protein
MKIMLIHYFYLECPKNMSNKNIINLPHLYCFHENIIENVIKWNAVK